MDTSKLLADYDKTKLTIVALGGHSALEVCIGAKKQGFHTCVVAKAGREKTYSKFLKTDENTSTGCVDDVIVVEEFSDILKPEIQKKLREMNALFVHSRYFWVYFKDFSQVETKFEVPILGTRELLRLEERDEKPNQYDVLRKAGIRLPKIFQIPELVLNKGISTSEEDVEVLNFFTFKNSEDVILHNKFTLPPKKDSDEYKKWQNQIRGLTLTKINNAERTYERENFIASSWEEWLSVVNYKIRLGEINPADVQKATIEEFVLGAQVNFNFFYSPLSKRLELLGTDTRRQTNLDGWLRLPAAEQLKLSTAGIQPLHIETGHIAVTVKESLLEKAYEAGEKFVATCKEFNPKGIVGPFALQGAIETDGKKEELVVFDVSFRMPGSPGIAATPYSNYLFGRSVSLGERIAMEVNAAVMSGRLEEIIS
jgi:5-formaminoimidazole-4-carboxamide-1-(beta)-D-ribofuranosyl 5'-monophosphate synthetase